MKNKFTLTLMSIITAISLAGCGNTPTCSHVKKAQRKDNVVYPTCTEEGSYDLVTYCTECSKVIDTENKTIEKLDHTEVIDEGYPATCTEEGLTDGSHCSVCGEILEQQQVIPAKGHTPVTDEVVDPDCEHTGLTEGSHCEECGEVLEEQEEIPATGHTPVVDPRVEPTFETTGLTEGSHCLECGKVLVEQQIIPKLKYEDYTYICTFAEVEHVSIFVYKTKDYTVDPTLSNVAYSRDDNGELVKDGEGQINFLVQIDEGFLVDEINIEGKYKNLKGPADTGKDNVYRITKIGSDLTINISVVEKTKSPVKFVLDSGVTLLAGEYDPSACTQLFQVTYNKYYINDELAVLSADGATIQEISKGNYQINGITKNTVVSIRSVCEFVDTEVGASINDKNELVLNWLNPTNRYKTLTAVISHGGVSENIDLTEIDARGERTYNYGVVTNALYAVSYSITTVGNKAITTFLSNFLYPSTDVANAGLGYLNITTQNNVFPYTHYIEHPTGQNGKSLIDNDYVKSNVSLYNKDGELVYQSAEDGNFDNAKMKCRGNTSAYANKKPLKIKLGKAYDMLEELIPGRKDSKINYKHKEWLLLRQTDLKQLCGTSVATAAGLEFAPSGIFVNVVMNGAYKGMYLLSECVSQGNGSGEKQSRLKVSDTGYIIENDAYWWNESLSMKTAINSSRERWTFKYPDADDITTESDEYKYIQNYLNTYEPYIKNKDDTAFNYIDMDSFIAWSIARLEITSADPAGTNMFVCKYDNTDASKVYAGVVWDFDNGFKEDRVETIDTIFNQTNYYAYYLLKMPTFLSALKKVVSTRLDNMLTQFQTDINLLNMTGYNTSIVLNAACWGESTKSLEASVNTLLDWMSRHNVYLKNKLNVK